MTRADTTPEEWRRRGRLAREWLDANGRGDSDPFQLAWGAASTGEPVDLGGAALLGLRRLEDGEDAAAEARACRVVIWGQPEDFPGLVLVPPGEELVDKGSVLAAHAPAQPFADVGLAVRFLARRFTERGDDQDLDAAVELHDLAVALGDALWEGTAPAALGWGAAELFAATGDEAFLATTERAADAMCEAQSPSGEAAPDLGADAAISGPGDAITATARLALVLPEMADAVDARLAAELDHESDDAVVAD